MKNRASLVGVLPFVLLALIGAQAVVTGILEHPYFCLGELAVMVLAAVFIVVYSMSQARRSRVFLETLSRQLGAESAVLTRLGLPVMAVKDDRVVWYNSAFLKQVLGGSDCIGQSPDFIVDPALIANSYGDPTEIEYNSHRYNFYSCEGESATICWFVDRSEVYEFKNKYNLARPVVTYITVDNIDDLQRDARDSEKTQISSLIEKRIETWSNELHAVCRRINYDRFILATDESGLKYMIDTRFDILNRVKEIDFGEKGSATLSIGVGRGGKDFSECEDMARQALDMALGRGGDQAAVRDKREFEFYGGTSSTGSKRSKVRTRIVASALRELIDSSDNVIVMGHRFADLDSFGSCYGFYRSVVESGKPCRIAISRERCMCSQLIDYVEKNNPDEQIIVDPDEAADLMTRKTLLVITDTHRPSFVDGPGLLDAAETVVVIDHHRKMVDHIAKAVIFYHDPYASSACEMVSELIQYMTGRIGRVESEALLAGIMLDTRNFVLNTGVRTFESSAYLRGCGANTVTVKSFFQNSVDVYKLKSEIVASAVVSQRCAVSYTDSASHDIRIAAAQAADEMLGIEGVDASFVAFEDNGTVNISARSLGRVNVQLIMEQLGGGGHLTMAAAQLSNTTEEEAMMKLKEAVDAYFKVNRAK